MSYVARWFPPPVSASRPVPATIPQSPAVSGVTLFREDDVDEAGLDELLRRARARDPEALTRLVEFYSARVFGLLYRLTGTRDAAEDLLQETVLRVARAIGQYEQVGKFEACGCFASPPTWPVTGPGRRGSTASRRRAATGTLTTPAATQRAPPAGADGRSRSADAAPAGGARRRVAADVPAIGAPQSSGARRPGATPLSWRATQGFSPFFSPFSAFSAFSGFSPDLVSASAFFSLAASTFRP